MYFQDVQMPVPPMVSDYATEKEYADAFEKYDSVRDAVDAVTAQTGLDRRKIYKQAIEIKNG